MERFATPQVAHHYPLLYRPARDKLLERFKALCLENFDGEQWLRGMDTIFNDLGCREQDITKLVLFQLMFSIVEWWEAKQSTYGSEIIGHLGWQEFKAKFLGKYFPESERDKKEK